MQHTEIAKTADFSMMEKSAVFAKNWGDAYSLDCIVQLLLPQLQETNRCSS